MSSHPQPMTTVQLICNKNNSTTGTHSRRALITDWLKSELMNISEHPRFAERFSFTSVLVTCAK